MVILFEYKSNEQNETDIHNPINVRMVIIRKEGTDQFPIVVQILKAISINNSQYPPLLTKANILLSYDLNNIPIRK